ncbi:unnamed protein product, partial [Brassica rapa subsp. trilocularis]
HKDQQIQGRTGDDIPDGGRQETCRNFTNILWKLSFASMEGRVVRGTLCHTSCANAQLKKICIGVSTSPHLVQFTLLNSPITAIG